MGSPEALEKIAGNIAQYGYHCYRVFADSSPAYLYTIGLTEKGGAELLFAGGAYYVAEELHYIIDRAAEKLAHGHDLSARFVIKDSGSFTLRKVHESWIKSFMLGAVDYYRGRDLAAYQLVPDRKHWTADIPDASVPWDPNNAGAWRFHSNPWPFQVPEDSSAITNVDALQGQLITEACRWEDDEWELFAGPGPDVTEDDARVLPLGVLLGLDPSLEAVLDLPIGQGLWRDANARVWTPWVRKGKGQN